MHLRDHLRPSTVRVENATAYTLALVLRTYELVLGVWLPVTLVLEHGQHQFHRVDGAEALHDRGRGVGHANRADRWALYGTEVAVTRVDDTDAPFVHPSTHLLKMKHTPVRILPEHVGSLGCRSSTSFAADQHDSQQGVPNGRSYSHSSCFNL
jgi:hypothetical protein